MPVGFISLSFVRNALASLVMPLSRAAAFGVAARLGANADAPFRLRFAVRQTLLTLWYSRRFVYRIFRKLRERHQWRYDG